MDSKPTWYLHGGRDERKAQAQRSLLFHPRFHDIVPWTDMVWGCGMGHDSHQTVWLALNLDSVGPHDQHFLTTHTRIWRNR